MHKVAIIILAGCILATTSCSLNEKQYKSGKPEKIPIDGYTNIMEKLLPKYENTTGETKGRYVVEYKVDGKYSAYTQIEGRVIDVGNEEPLPFANILIVDTKKGTVTDLNGEFFLKNIQPGTYSIQVRMMGYESLIADSIVADTGRICIINFRLGLEMKND